MLISWCALGHPQQAGIGSQFLPRGHRSPGLGTGLEVIGCGPTWPIAVRFASQTLLPVGLCVCHPNARRHQPVRMVGVGPALCACLLKRMVRLGGGHGAEAWSRSSWQPVGGGRMQDGGAPRDVMWVHGPQALPAPLGPTLTAVSPPGPRLRGEGSRPCPAEDQPGRSPLRWQRHQGPVPGPSQAGPAPEEAGQEAG